jgi:hypothetical protein
MKAWETNKSPKAVASICHAHEIRRQEIKQAVKLHKCTMMIDTCPAAAQCQEKSAQQWRDVEKERQTALQCLK